MRKKKRCVLERKINFIRAAAVLIPLVTVLLLLTQRVAAQNT